jgi:hypothetical protein
MYFGMVPVYFCAPEVTVTLALFAADTASVPAPVVMSAAAAHTEAMIFFALVIVVLLFNRLSFRFSVHVYYTADLLNPKACACQIVVKSSDIFKRRGLAAPQCTY